MICPNFALDMARKDKLKTQIARNIQLQEYKWAMSEGKYNKGRTLKDVDGMKSKIHGTRKYLRPDTFWADERYVNVTQEDIDEAKVRHSKRMEGTKTQGGIFQMAHQPDNITDIHREKPLYGL